MDVERYVEERRGFVGWDLASTYSKCQGGRSKAAFMVYRAGRMDYCGGLRVFCVRKGRS